MMDPFASERGSFESDGETWLVEVAGYARCAGECPQPTQPDEYGSYARVGISITRDGANTPDVTMRFDGTSTAHTYANTELIDDYPLNCGAGASAGRP